MHFSNMSYDVYYYVGKIQLKTPSMHQEIKKLQFTKA